MPINIRFSSLALCLVAALPLAGCAGGSGSRGGGGISGSASSGERVPGTVESMDTGTREWMAEGLRQFSRGDPRWDDTRAEWLALGERESRLLVSVMFAALMRAQELNEPHLVERARHELVFIGGPAASMLSSVISTATAYEAEDPETGDTVEVPVDDTARNEAAEILSMIGEPAAPALIRALDDAESKSGQRAAVRALGNMGARGGPSVAGELVRWSSTSDWVLRVEAVWALRRLEDGASRSALMRALSDEEPLVREKAADALGVRRDRSTIGALRTAASAARNAGRLAEGARMERAVKAIEVSRR